MFSQAMAQRIEHQNNPRGNSDGRGYAPAGSIAAFALSSPILVDGSSVIAGAMHPRAAYTIGLDTMPVVELYPRERYAN
jgi:hypothetical protein